MDALAWGLVSSPVGDLSLACGPAGLVRVCFGGPGAGAAGGRWPAGPAASRSGPAASAVLEQAQGELSEYFAGRRREFSVPLDWSRLSDAHERVLRTLAGRVSFGQTVTYGGLAELSGLADGIRVAPGRAVGQMMGANPWPIIVPCHRVLAGDGLGGYSGGTGVEVKRWLLIFEGALPPTLDWDPAGPPTAG